MEAAWITFRDTAMECLGPSTRRHREWFDENHAEIMDLIGKKCAAHLAHLHDPYCTTKKDALRSICSTIQLKLCEMSADGTKLISEKNKILERWAEHFNCLLNRPFSISERVTRCHSNPGGSSNSYLSTIQRQSTWI